MVVTDCHRPCLSDFCTVKLSYSSCVLWKLVTRKECAKDIYFILWFELCHWEVSGWLMFLTGSHYLSLPLPLLSILVIEHTTSVDARWVL